MRAQTDSAADVRYGGVPLSEWRQRIRSVPIETLGTPDQVLGLMEIVKDPQAPWGDRRHCALTLAKIGPPAAAAIPLFRSLLQNDEADSVSTRLWSLKALGLFGQPAVTATDDVLSIVRDETELFLIRSTAMETLVQIAPGDPRTLSALVRIMESDRSQQSILESNELRRAAAESLSLLGPTAAPALPELLRGLQSDWPVLQRSSATALGALGVRGELAVDPLVDEVLFGEHDDVREAAADALGSIGPPATQALSSLLSDEEKSVRMLAIRGLRQSMDSQGVRNPLTKCFADPDSEIRVFAADALLNHQSSDAAVAVLLDGLQEHDRQTRFQAYRTLQSHLSQLKPHQNKLQSIEQDPSSDPQTRQAASRLLHLLNGVN